MKALHPVIAWALPPRCAGCGTPVEADGRFCSSCWQSLRFLGPPWCAACHTPFAFDRGEGARCAACLANPPRHAGVRAAVAYGPVARTLAMRLKYGRRVGMAATMAAAMIRLLPPDTELLVPVPLHRRRLWWRGFNQAALIADAIGRAAGVPVARDALLRDRATHPLRDMGPRERRAAVAGAFAIDPRCGGVVTGRRVTLVDDVYTSGATTDGCVKALHGAGAGRVVVLCWARVVAEAGLD